MTTVYFVRHAESDSSIRNAMTRPLTPKGLQDRKKIIDFLEGQHIDAVLSSPYQRAADTVIPLAEQNGLSVQTIDEFREHETALDALSDEDYFREIQRYWTDLSYKIGSDESLAQVQSRNIHALEHFLAKYSGKAIAIGTHGMALSTIIHYYDPLFGYKEFVSIAKIKPWLVRMTFQGKQCLCVEPIDLFHPDR